MKTLTKSFRMLLPAICCIFWLNAAQAQVQNIIVIHDAVELPGSNVVIYVELLNGHNIFGFRFDVPLPEGYDYVSGSASLNPARHQDFIVLASVLSGTNIVRFLSYPLTGGGGGYIGNNGIIMTFILNNSVLPGCYLLIPENAILGNSAGQNVITGTMDGSVIVTSDGRIPGDANCDGLVNVIDVVTSITYILGTIPEWFCFQNADLNSDLLVNVADVVGTINIILGLRSGFSDH